MGLIYSLFTPCRKIYLYISGVVTITFMDTHVHPNVHTHNFSEGPWEQNLGTKVPSFLPLSPFILFHPPSSSSSPILLPLFFLLSSLSLFSVCYIEMLPLISLISFERWGLTEPWRLICLGIYSVSLGYSLGGWLMCNREHLFLNASLSSGEYHKRC